MTLLDTYVFCFISGEYRTAVERQEGTAGNTHSLIYGIGNYHEPNTTFGFHVVWRKGASVTGFVGKLLFSLEHRIEKILKTFKGKKNFFKFLTMDQRGFILYILYNLCCF